MELIWLLHLAEVSIQDFVVLDPNQRFLKNKVHVSLTLWLYPVISFDKNDSQRNLLNCLT